MHCRCASAGLVLATVAIMHHMPVALAHDSARRVEQPRAGSPTGPGEFQTQVGDRVFFSEGSAQLGARARLVLEAQAHWLIRNPAFVATIEGHADEPGADDQLISERRAEAVRMRLIEAGVPPERVRSMAFGKARAIAYCPDAACAAHNRRAVTVVARPVEAESETALVRDRWLGRRSPRRQF